jgi:hypothetical protein
VRFLGAGIDDQNFTDDIILDQTAPTLQSAQLLGGAGAASAARAKPKTRRFKIKVVAEDTRVGVCAVAAAPRRAGGTVVTLRKCRDKGIAHLDTTVAIRSTSTPKYVRVRNSAGKWSNWRELAA